jgi:hypothetical protein
LVDRGGQLFEGRGVNVFAGLPGVGLNLGQRYLVELVRGIRRRVRIKGYSLSIRGG